MFSQLPKRSARFLPADLCTDHAHCVKNHKSTVLWRNKRDFTTVACDGWIDVTSRKPRVTFYRRPSGTVCFRSVSRRADNGETAKTSCILIVTFLLKLSSQWVKYALACVYIDLPIGEMKKKKRNCLISFITSLAAAWRLLVFYPAVVWHGRGKLPKRKVRPDSNIDLFMYRT